MKTQIRFIIIAAALAMTVCSCSKDDDKKDQTVAVTSVMITEGATLNLAIGATQTLHATVQPENATDKTVIWSSNPASTVSVDARSGVIKGLEAGIATVTATAGGRSASITITVAADVVSVTGVLLSPDKLTLHLDDSKTGSLTATVTPENATNKAVTYTSGCPEVATVNETGLVTAVGGGKTTITATTKDGQREAQADVSVFISLPDGKWSYPQENDASSLSYTDAAFQWREQPLPLLVTFDFEGDRCGEFVVELTFSSAAEATRYRADMKNKDGYTIDLSDKKISIRVTSASKHLFIGKSQLELTTYDIIGGASKSIIDQLCSVPKYWRYSTNNSYVFEYEDHKDFNSKLYPVELALDFEGTGASCSTATMAIQFKLNEGATVDELVTRLNTKFGNESVTVAKKLTVTNQFHVLTIESSLIAGDIFKGQTKDAIWQIESQNVKLVLDNYYKTLVEIELGNDWRMPDLNQLIYIHDFGAPPIIGNSWKLTFTYDRFGECTGTELVYKFRVAQDATTYKSTLTATALANSITSKDGKTVTVNVGATSNNYFAQFSKRDIVIRDPYSLTNRFILK
ncbi:Ig-like domain-containing protein [Phocaeicola sp.]